MRTIERTVRIAAPIDAVFHFHDDVSNLGRITPPNIRIEILEGGGPMRVGKRVKLRMTQFGVLRQTLEIEFVRYEPVSLIVDEQRTGPFRFWRQTRRFRSVEGGTELTDIVEYDVGLGPIGAIADRLLIAPRVDSMFAYRQQALRRLLEERESS